MGGKLECYTKSSNPFFSSLLVGSSHFPWRQIPAEARTSCSGALQHTLSLKDALGAMEGSFSLTLLYWQHLLPPLTLHVPPPKLHCVQRAGGLLKYRRHFLAIYLVISQHSLAAPLPTTGEKGHFVPCCIASFWPPFSLQKEAQGAHGYIWQRKQPCKKS